MLSAEPKLSQPWTSKFVRMLADDQRREAREHAERNWLYSQCKAICIADALDHLAEHIENKTR